MADKKIITVFGATGNQGGAVVDIFLNDPKLKNDWAVRGVTRDVTKDSSKKLASKGVEVVSANVDDGDSLRSVMAGAHTVFAMTNYWDKMDHELEEQQGRKMADAAKEAGVQHFIWSSLVNVTQLTNGKLSRVYHFDSKAKVEQYVRSIGIPATFFLPGFFMSNLPGGMFNMIPPSNTWTLALPMPETAPIPMFDTADSGKWIKAIVLKRGQLLGKQIYAATDYVTPAEIVAAFKKAYPEVGASAAFVSVPHDDFLAANKNRGMPEFAAVELLENMRLMDEGGYYGGVKLDESHSILEDRLTTWEDFMKKAGAFASLK